RLAARHRRWHLRRLASLALFAEQPLLQRRQLLLHLGELRLLVLGVSLPAAVVLVVVGRRGQQPALIIARPRCRSFFSTARLSDRKHFVLFSPRSPGGSWAATRRLGEHWPIRTHRAASPARSHRVSHDLHRA